MGDEKKTKKQLIEELSELRRHNCQCEALDPERKQVEEKHKANLDLLSKKNRYGDILGTVIRSVHRSIDLEEVYENSVDALSGDIERVEHIGIYMVEDGEAVLKAHRGFPD